MSIASKYGSTLRPALQKLLSRPSSLDLLWYLVRHCPGDARTHRQTTYEKGTGSRQKRQLSSVAVSRVADQRQDEDVAEGERIDMISPLSKICFLRQRLQHSQKPPAKSFLSDLSTKDEFLLYGAWGRKEWSLSQLEFESDIEDRNLDRLVNRKDHKRDIKLWAFLLHCRLRKQKGVNEGAVAAIFWDALLERGVDIPTEGLIGNVLWEIFVQAGLQGRIPLESICDQADKICMRSGNSWANLYTWIVRHHLLNGGGTGAIEWHNRLQKYHSPSNRRFMKLCSLVTSRGGDLVAMKKIYKQSDHTNLYSTIVPILCSQENYKAALDWHFFFIRSGDLPRSSKIVEPLVNYLSIYNPPAAVRVTQSLVKAGVFFVDSLLLEPADNTKISREIMNKIHGETFNISVKTYSDSLGARWLATSWVSLDIAIRGIHALGVREIGPLSLQSIALREPTTEGVVSRIEELKELGISIGESLYSKAIDHFARTKAERFLDGLLQSDQHPDELEDWKLQEELLTEYFRNSDWENYKRTMAIQTLNSKVSWLVAERNLMVRLSLAPGEIHDIRRNLIQMRLEGIQVLPRTTSRILRCVLNHREPSKLPMPFGRPHDDLREAIWILKYIMDSGNYVPVTHWREIIRRLGMTGNLERLEHLCLDLVDRYGPRSTRRAGQHHYHHVPIQVPTSHSLHPLNVLFSAPCQYAIVEWGFIHALTRLQRLPSSKAVVRMGNVTRTPMTFGISLLKQLGGMGVHIHSESVRKAIVNRLISYYGAGRSKRPHNRVGRRYIGLPLEEVAKEIDQALGVEYFSRLNIVDLTQNAADVRLRKLYRRGSRTKLLRETLRQESLQPSDCQYNS